MSRIAHWKPPLVDSIRLAWRPALAYLVFTFLGSAVLVFTSAYYSHGSGKDTVLFMLGTAAGMFGVLLGQLISILRFRAFPVFIVTGICATFAAWLMSYSNPPGGDYVAVPLVFFAFAFPCGLLSLMHRYELFASFWPAVGWIGGVFVILNEEGRVASWEENKIKAWLPVPLAFLAGFLVLWLFYLAAKQAARVEMWQALSGAAARRIAKRDPAKVSAIPRRNLLPLLGIAALLFVATAILGPYLWRTGKGDRESHNNPGDDTSLPKPPDIDGEGIVRQLERMAQAAKDTIPRLWPLLLLFLLYRPLKRALLLTHLKTPIFPTPPSERIDNLWEYVRIAAEDAGIVPTSADSVEQLLARFPHPHAPSVLRSAEIYVRTRYGFVVAPGDAGAMRGVAIEAAKSLRKDLSLLKTVANWWRPLA